MYYDSDVASRRGPDNSVRVAIQGTSNGLPWANVFWCQCTVSGTPVQADLDAWLTSLAAAYATRFNSQRGNSVADTAARATYFLSGGLVLESTIALASGGSGGTQLTDNSGSSLISWASGVYWRGGKPRTYLAPPPATFVTLGSQLTGAAKTSLLAAARGFRTDVNALTHGAITGTSLGFVSFFTDKALRATPVFFPFLDAVIHTRLATQRRRLGQWLV